jgi:hypothetical protein
MGADDAGPDRPAWWDWELAFTSHVDERMLERGFSELELRAMLDDAGELAPSRRSGRWYVRTRHRGQAWVVVIEPDEETRTLVIVTAYARD